MTDGDGDGDGDGAGELILSDNRILIPGDLTENDIVGDLNLCAPGTLSRVSLETFPITK
jgi:hypothetical protein